MVEVEPGLSSAQGARHLAVAHGVYTVGKFVAVFLMRFIKPRILLAAAVTLNIVFLAAVVGTKGKAGIAMICMEFFFKSCIFPTIFSISLRGLGDQTKRGAAILVASFAGGGIQAPIVGAIADRSTTRIGMAVPLAAMILVWTFAMYLNVVKARELDAFWYSDIGRASKTGRKDGTGKEARKAKENAVESDSDIARIRQGDEEACQGTFSKSPAKLKSTNETVIKTKGNDGQDVVES